METDAVKLQFSDDDLARAMLAADGKKDRVSAIAVYLAKSHFGLEFAGNVEVCPRAVVSGMRADLAINPHDAMVPPRLLVRVRLEHKHADIVGWLCGWEAIERTDKVWDEQRKVFDVPPPYHSLLSLRQWLECGHRPHWMPKPFLGIPRVTPYA